MTYCSHDVVYLDYGATKEEYDAARKCPSCGKFLTVRKASVFGADMKINWDWGKSRV